MMVQRTEHKAVSLNHAMSFFKIILSNYPKLILLAGISVFKNLFIEGIAHLQQHFQWNDV